jgi:hypothetical protein
MADTTFTSGTTVASSWLNDANVATYERVSNITALKALDKTRFTRARTLGYSTPGDGGHGEYYYDSSDTTSSDNGGSIIVATDGGRWKLIHQGTFYAEQFGAKGDWNGTTGTDDAAALQAAINALPSVGGRIALRQGKRYLVGSQLTAAGTGHIDIFGAGAAEASNNVGSTEIIKSGSLSTAVLNITSPFAKIRDLVVRGATGNTGDGIQISANSVTLDHVSVFSMGNDGVRIGLDSGTNANSWTLSHCRLNNNSRFGLYISDQVSPTLPNANAGTWINCVAQSNGNDGVRIGNATLNTLVGGTVESNGGCGLRINGAGANYNSVIGMDFDSGNASGKLRIEAGAVYNRIDSATVNDTEIVDNGTLTQLNVPNSSNAGWYSKGVFRMQMGNPGGRSVIASGASGGYLGLLYGGDTETDANLQVIAASDGTHIGKSTGGLIGFYGVTPVARATTAGAAATFVANAGTAVNDASTFDGYTIKQVVKALRTIGLLT